MASPFDPPAYSSDQIEEVRKALRHQLKELGAVSVISKLVSELQLQSDVRQVAPHQALQVLKERGVVEQIARSVTAPPHLVAKVAASNLVQAASPAGPTSDGQRYLQVKLLGARAMVDYVTRNPLPGEMLQLSMELFGHRLDSDWVPACAEPTFSGEAFLPLPTTHDLGQGQENLGQGQGKQVAVAGLPDPLQLLSFRQPLHLVILSCVPTVLVPASDVAATLPGPSVNPGPWPDVTYSCSPCTVVALGAGDWRTALLRNKPVVVSIQMGAGPGLSLGIPSGSAPACTVTLQLCIHPRPSSPMDEALLQTQQRNEAHRDMECTGSFLRRAKAWWSQYVRLDKAFVTRPVKVLARSEDGVQRPTPSFLRPLQVSRSLPTPRHAARFVSLLRQREHDATWPADAGAAGAGLVGAKTAGGGLVSECWCDPHTVLACRSACEEERALLLCGLLLGFGQDAYVAVGRRHGGAGAVWVVTRAAFAETTHWDPSTGARYTALKASACPFWTVGSLFNNQRVYANCQAEDRLMHVSYLVEETSLWHELEVAPADVAGPSWSTLPLRSTVVDTATLELTLEQQIKAVLMHHRPGPLPVWDMALEHMLMPALEAYEYEAVSGELAPGTDEFQTAIKRATPVGWVFRGVPQHHRHIHAPVIAASLLDDSQAIEILNSVEGVLALRLKVVAYPEGLFSCWCMLASKAKAATAT